MCFMKMPAGATSRVSFASSVSRMLGPKCRGCSSTSAGIVMWKNIALVSDAAGVAQLDVGTPASPQRAVIAPHTSLPVCITALWSSV